VSRMELVTRSNRALWFAVAAGPIAWSVDALAAVAIDVDTCAHRPTSHGGAAQLALLALGVIAALIAAAGATTGWRMMNRETDTGFGDTIDDRRRFMARFGLVISTLAAIGIIFRTIGVLFIAAGSC
jgi:hypothetical protein